jgi:hypothetical protein
MLITISRQFGAGGSAVAAKVADALGWRVVDNELVERVAARRGSPEDVATREERCRPSSSAWPRPSWPALRSWWSPESAGTVGSPGRRTW